MRSFVIERARSVEPLVIEAVRPVKPLLTEQARVVNALPITGACANLCE